MDIGAVDGTELIGLHTHCHRLNDKHSVIDCEHMMTSLHGCRWMGVCRERAAYAELAVDVYI